MEYVKSLGNETDNLEDLLAASHHFVPRPIRFEKTMYH